MSCEQIFFPSFKHSVYLTMNFGKYTGDTTKDPDHDTSRSVQVGRKKISVSLSRDEILVMMKLLEEEFPNPKPALHFANAFELLCAVMLSAQTTDEAVNKVTPLLFERAPDPRRMVALGEEQIGEIIKSLGLWRNKSRNLIRLSEMLIAEHQGQVPDDFKALISLPGVGEKTAYVVLNVIFGHPLIAVDTHIFRVCKRTGLCEGRDALSVQHALGAIVPSQYQKEAHHRLLYHGRFVCKAAKPLCADCVLRNICVHKEDFNSDKRTACGHDHIQK